MSSPFTRSLVANGDDVKLLMEYLEKRCLEPNDFPEGLIPFRDADLLRQRNYLVRHACGRPYIFLRYLDPSGKPYLKDNEPYELVRFLGEPKGVWGDKDPPLKVLSPGKRPNQLHFEPIRPLDGEQRDWASLPDHQVVIHVESMIKAKAVHRWTGYPCVGLNGVYGWSASKQGIEVIHSQTGIDFSRFRNVLLFDANTSDPKKPEVTKARNGLAFKLRNVLGCKDVRIAELPRSDDGEYWGPDDFLAAKGNAALDAIILKAEEYSGSLDDSLIGKIQDKVVFCRKSGHIIDREDKQVRDIAGAREWYRTINRKELQGKQIKTTYALDLWRDSAEARRVVVDPCYLYMGEEFVEKSDGEYYNLYKKSGPDPLEVRTGAADPIIRQLENMFTPAHVEHYRSYLKFLKYETGKPCSFMVIYGAKKGIGKGWSTVVADRLIGFPNSISARGRDLGGTFNAILQARRLILFNEYTPDGNRATALNHLKGLAGDEYMTIEPKGIDPYQVENRAGAIFTTNYLEDIPNDGMDDRRMEYMHADPKVEVTPEGWDVLFALPKDEEVMRDFAAWVREGVSINFSTWRPNPLDRDRRGAILDSARGIPGDAMQLMAELKDEGYVCLRTETVYEIFRKHYGYTDLPEPRSLTSQLKRGQWVRSKKDTYGLHGNQRCVWIVDEEKFALIEHDNKAVMAEYARVATRDGSNAKF